MGSGSGAITPLEEEEELEGGLLGQARMKVGFGFGEISSESGGIIGSGTAQERLREFVIEDRRRAAAERTALDLETNDRWSSGGDVSGLESSESAGTISHKSMLSDELRGQARRTLSADGKGERDDRVRSGSHPLKKYDR